MIARICILAAGVLLAAAGVLLWKKLSPAWRSALLAGGILTASIGGVFLYGFWQQRQRDREYVYLSLRYLQNSDTDSAAYYLKKVGRIHLNRSVPRACSRRCEATACWPK